MFDQLNSFSRIGPETQLKGIFVFKEDTYLLGELTGEIQIPENSDAILYIGEPAVIQGNIKAPEVIISGAFSGTIEVTRKLTIMSFGKVEGKVYAHELKVHSGAVLKAQIFPTSDERNQKLKEIEAIFSIFDEPQYDL